MIIKGESRVVDSSKSAPKAESGSKPRVTGSSAQTANTTPTSTASTANTSSHTTTTGGGTASAFSSRPGGGGNGGGGTSGGSSKLGGIAVVLSALALGLAGWLFNRTSIDSAEQAGVTTGVDAKVEAVSSQFDDVKSEMQAVTAQVEGLKEQLAVVKSGASDSVSSAKAEAVDQVNSIKGLLTTEVSKIRAEDLADIQKTQADRTKQVGEIRAEVAKLSGSVDQVYAELDKSLGEWRLQEVEQLMVTANDRLNLAGDVDIATTALKFADDRMRDMKDPSLADVRGEVANDLSSLAAVEPADIAGVSARIRTLMGGIEGLEIVRGGFQGAATPAAETDSAAEDQAANADDDGGSLFKRLSGSIASVGQDAMRKVNESTKATKSYVPPLAPDQKYFLVENLRLQYNTAQLALFERDQDTFSGSLQAAADWTKKYFNPDVGGAADAVNDATALSETIINPELPDISGSLQELRKVIKARTAQ